MSIDNEEEWKAGTLRTLVIRWAGISVRFFSLQLVIQGLNFLSGMLTVWYLSKPEYALVTITVMLLGSMVVLSNLGIAIGVTSIGGRVSQDSHRFGSVVATALRLRRTLSFYIFPMVAAVLALALWRAEAPWWQVVSITTTAIGIASLDLSASLFSSALLLRDRVQVTQKADLASAILRLALIATLAVPGWLGATLSMLAVLFSASLRNVTLHRAMRQELDLSAPEVPEDRAEILRITRLEAPNSIFYCLQGQISIAIMTYFGSINQIAEYGALGRFTIITTLIGSFFSSLLVPKFNRLQIRSQLTRRYLTLMSMALTIALVLAGTSLLIPDTLLWFLGPKYAQLRHELPLMVANSMISFITGIAWSMNASKAWIAIIARLNIPMTLLTQIAIAPLCHLETLSGVILFSLISQLPIVLLLALDAWRGLRSSPVSPV